MTPPKPQTIRLQRNSLPSELRRLDQWVCWRWELVTDKNGKEKWTKVPIDARTGKRADTTDSETWAPFSVACYYLDQHPDQVDGIGFVFSEDDPFFGIDLDNARDPETGALTAAAQAIVDRFDTFTEWSIRNDGVHVIGIGELPGGKGRKRSDLGIEVYDRDRFFVVSGHVIINDSLIGDRADELLAWHAELWPPKPEPQRVAPAAALSADDAELFQWCLGNEKFRRLHHGDDSDYGDDTSSADLAYCNIIVRNGGTAAQIDALYRQSGRYRDKWDSKRGDSTYGAWTISRALDGTIVPFEPAPRPTVNTRWTAGEGPKPQDAEMVDDELPDDVAGLKAIIIDLRTRVVAAERRAAAAEERAFAAEWRAEHLGELQSKTVSIIRNKNLGQERFTAVALAYQLGNKEAAGDAGNDGMHRMPLARIAEAAGISEDTASKHLKKLEEAKLIRRKLDWVPDRVDQSTGEILTPGHKALFVGTPSNVTDFIEAVAKLDPEKPKNWGGARLQCADHPNADIIKETTWRCAECGEQVRPPEIEHIRPKPQDAEMVDDDLAATGTDGPSPRSSNFTRQRGTSTSSGSGTGSHNVASPDSVAGRWTRGQPLMQPVDLGVPF